MRLLILLIIVFLPTASCIAYLYLLNPVTKSSKKLKTLIHGLKHKGKYEEWAQQHKELILFENVFPYFRYSVLLLVLFGFLIEFSSVPEIAVGLFKIIGYAYWPLAFVVITRMSKLQKNIPELQSKSNAI